jgi:uncharacterized protein (DUF1499 family)
MGLFSGKPPRNLGVSAGKLAPCPATPNCACSQSEGKSHVAPLDLGENPDQAWESLQSILSRMPGVTLMEVREDYLYAECATPLMGFVDDLELYRDRPGHLCQVRSASRLGYSDLGKNRQRVEKIRSQLAL